MRRKVTRFSYELERQYYGRRPPEAALPFGHLEPYMTSWLPEPKTFFRDKVVLDIGAGEATYSRLIAERYEPRLLVACDIFPERMRHAATVNESENLRFLVGDCFSLPIKSESVDVVFGSLVLCQLPDLDVVAAEMARVLKPGGIYVGIEPNVLNLAVLTRLLFASHSRNQYTFGVRHLKVFQRHQFDVDFRYFYWKFPTVRSRFIGTCIGLVMVKKTITISLEPARVALPLVIPAGTRYSIIFRAKLDGPITVSPRGDVRVRAITNWYSCCRALPEYLRTFGILEMLRVAAKIFLGRRLFFYASHENRVVSYVWLCKFQKYLYPVESGDCTISVVSTSTFYRRRGLAAHLMRIALNHAYSKGHRTFFIETAADNEGMLAAIKQLGIWQPVGSFLRLGPRFNL